MPSKHQFKSVVIDTLSRPQIEKYVEESKKPNFDKWFFLGQNVIDFVYSLQRLGYGMCLIAGYEGTGKSFGMRNFTSGSNIWINLDFKDPTWKGGFKDYGRKFQPKPSHWTFEDQGILAYGNIIKKLKGAQKHEYLDPNCVIFVLSHLRQRKDDSYTVHSVGQMVSNFNIESAFENRLVAETKMEDGEPKYFYRTKTTGTGDFCSSMEGLFDEMFIDNDMNLVRENIVRLYNEG